MFPFSAPRGERRFWLRAAPAVPASSFLTSHNICCTDFALRIIDGYGVHSVGVKIKEVGEAQISHIQRFPEGESSVSQSVETSSKYNIFHFQNRGKISVKIFQCYISKIHSSLPDWRDRGGRCSGGNQRGDFLRAPAQQTGALLKC